MKDALPKGKPHVNENAIINLDNQKGQGTHWTCYRKRGSKIVYFDSFGNLKPPQELFDYWNVKSVQYNYEKFQDFNTFHCGHICLQFLCNNLGISA